MKTHTRHAPSEEQSHARGPSTLDLETGRLDLDNLSDEELEDLLFDEEQDESSGFFNLPTVAGLSLITVGIAYLLQQLGILSGFDLSTLATMLPWLAGVLIILLGFGVLSWRPAKKRKSKKKKAVEVSTGKKKIVEEAETDPSAKHRLTKSKHDRKIFGVCGGIAERLGVDPTLVRIAFVIGTLAFQGPFVVAYLALAYFMPEPTAEERITIIRDS